MARARQPQPDLLPGTLDVMILRTLSHGEEHGYGIARRIERASGGELLIEEGSLYPALHKLEKRGDVVAAWRMTELNRRGKYYSLTPQGRSRLREDVKLWARLSSAVTRVLGAEAEGGAARAAGGAA